MMILATRRHVGKNEELLHEMSTKCFPDRMVWNGVSPAEVRTLRRVVAIVDLPIELLARAYYELIDIGLNPATLEELRQNILHEDDYSRYFEKYAGIEIENAIYTFHLRRKQIIEQVEAGTY